MEGLGNGSWAGEVGRRGLLVHGRGGGPGGATGAGRIEVDDRSLELGGRRRELGIGICRSTAGAGGLEVLSGRRWQSELGLKVDSWRWWKGEELESGGLEEWSCRRRRG